MFSTFSRKDHDPAIENENDWFTVQFIFRMCSDQVGRGCCQFSFDLDEGVLIIMKRLFLAILAVLSLGVAAQAQTFRGTILGTVTDASGAAVAGATVTAKNTDTGLTRTMATAQDGSFAAPELPIGNYSLTVEKSGFKTGVVSGIRVEVSSERRADVVLQPGEIAQRIEVSGESLPLVETTSNTRGGVFESKQVEDLPINGRDYTKLLINVPGAAGEPNGAGDSPGSFGYVAVNGNRGRANNFMLDGTDENDGYRNDPAINEGGVFGTPGTVLPLDAIAEVRVLSNFAPEYGRNAGGVINIVTKSGTNDFHGSGYEFFRNDHLNARNFFNTEPAKDAFRNNQYGGTIGGPLVRDKTFFFLAYEGQREGGAITSLVAQRGAYSQLKFVKRKLAQRFRQSRCGPWRRQHAMHDDGHRLRSEPARGCNQSGDSKILQLLPVDWKMFRRKGYLAGRQPSECARWAGKFR